MNQKMKIQWIVNMALLVFTLLSLVLAVVAWYSNDRSSEVDSVQLSVSRKDLKLVNEVTTVEFPYSTKIADTTAEQAFNNGAAVAKDYVLKGEGALNISVDCHNSGMLAYVCDNSTDAIDYDEIYQALSEKLGSDSTTWNYDNMTQALREINARAMFGTMPGDGNTHIRIIYWTEYDAVKDRLSSEQYVDLTDSEGFKATVTFVADG